MITYDENQSRFLYFPCRRKSFCLILSVLGRRTEMFKSFMWKKEETFFDFYTLRYFLLKLGLSTWFSHILGKMLVFLYEILNFLLIMICLKVMKSNKGVTGFSENMKNGHTWNSGWIDEKPQITLIVAGQTFSRAKFLLMMTTTHVCSLFFYKIEQGAMPWMKKSMHLSFCNDFNKSLGIFRTFL